MTYLAAVLGVVTATLGLSAAWLQFRNSQHGRRVRLVGRISKRRLAKAARSVRSSTASKPVGFGSPGALEPISCGPVTIDVSMVVGSLQTAWTPEEISARYDAQWSPDTPKEIRSHFDLSLANRLAEARDDGSVIFDGATYALRDYHLTVTDPVTERTRLELLLGPTTFFEYLATNQSLQEKHLRRALTSFVSRADVGRFPLSDQLAANFSVITSDGFFLLQRRSHRVANFSGLLACGVNATMQRGDPARPGDENHAGDPDPIAAVVRECEEELGVVVDRSNLKVFGLAFDHRHLQPLLVGELRVPMTYAELRSNAMAWARDKFEYERFEALAVSPRATLDSFAGERWVPVCALTTLISTIAHVGRAEVLRRYRGYEGGAVRIA